ncbi:MAG: TonB-dependent receptor [bacterium]
MKKTFNRGREVFFLLLLFLLTSNISASLAEHKGTLHGTIMDVAGINMPVANAVVTLIEKEITVTSDENGMFNFYNLTDGNYHIQVNHIAYKDNMVSYNFNEDNLTLLVIYIEPKAIEISTVIVSGQAVNSQFEEYYENVNVVKGKELQKNLGLTLASTLKNETGLAIRSMGPAPARPVIRGLGGDRVLISEDGIETTDLSSTSPDHAVTIEPFSIDRIEVIRGPKVLTKTSTTIGGVVNVIKQEIPDNNHQNIIGSLGLYGESANNGYLGSLITEIPISNFQLRFEGSRRKTDDLSTPIGTLMNSNSENINLCAGGSYIDDFGYLGLSYRDYELNYGIPGGFVGAHPKGVDIDIFRRQLNLKSKINLSSNFFNNAEISISRTLYRHKEFESNGSIGSEFKIVNYAGLVNFIQKKFGIINEGIAGLSFESRDFDIGGRVFTSPTNSFNLSAYLFENFTTGKFNFEFGARYNYDVIDPERKNENAKIGNVRKRVFNTYSLSFSTMYSLTDIVFVGANISKSSRVPTIEELFSEGPHLAAYSHEIGNPDLIAESGIGAEVFIYHKFDELNFTINLFRNQINNYIIPRNTGETNYSTFLPIYATYGVGAMMYGFEGQFDWKAFNDFSISSSISYTNGKFTETNKPLPQIPPMKLLLELKYKVDELSIGLNSEIVPAQNLVDEFEEPTAGYAVFNFYAQYSIASETFIHNFSFTAENIFNKEYRNHLSRVKSIMPEAGRSLRLTYKMYFNL